MEFLDEDARPRFHLQSGAPTSSNPNDPQNQQTNLGKPFLFLTISVSFLLLGLSLFFLQSEPSKSILIWVALSVLVGPFAPISLTGGDIRVGQGPILETSTETAQSDEETKRVSQKRSKSRRSEDVVVDSTPLVGNIDGSLRKERKNEDYVGNSNGVVASSSVQEEKKEWAEEDTEILKKQLLKHPVGKPRRWEVIAEAFQGRYKVETVIKKAKELGEKKVGDEDSYSQFLKKRKPVDKRIEDVGNGGNLMAENGGIRKESEGGGGGGGDGWSSEEDIALLNALKAFPKDAPMRWEKIVASVPGKSKAACMKRVAELKRDFRSSKTASQS